MVQELISERPVKPSRLRNSSFHRASNTYIPRPISGTSRRASSSLFTSPSNDGIVESRAENLLTPCVQHMSLAPRRILANESMPPSSFTTPKGMLPRSDSSVSYLDRSKTDLPDIQERLQVKNSSTHAIDSSPERSTYLHANFRQITPRTLMKPIQPSLPRSQTTGNIACFPSIHDISPSRPPRKSSLAHSLTQNNSTHLPAVDALFGSRMSKPETHQVDALQNERLTDRDRVTSNSCMPPRRTEAPRLSTYISTSSNSKLLPGLSHSSTKVTNNRRQGVEETTQAKRPLFINTTLANTARVQAASPLSYSTPGSETTCFTLSSTEPSPVLQHVYRAEVIGYWAGRYVATTDRTRKVDCENLFKQKELKELYINSPAFELLFERAENSRMTRVLEELRECCKSQEAAKSLDKFEIQLKKRLEKAPSSFIRSYSGIFSKSIKEEPKAVKVAKPVSGTSNNASDLKNQATSFNAQATIEKLSSMVMKKGGLTKSKTTGDLTLKPTCERISTPGLTSASRNLNKPAAPLQARKVSEAKRMNDTGAITIRDREARYRSLEKHLKQPIKAEDLPEIDTTIANVAQNFSTEFVIGAKEPRPSRDRRMNSIQTVLSAEPNGLPIAPASGYRLSDKPALTRSSTWTVPYGGSVQETILYQEPRKRRGSGQRNGEFVKKVVGAGIREVRKMSRRVGSMGLSSSSDDVSSGV